MGILPRPPRTSAGYRRYPREAVARVQLVRRALRVGFTLSELARILRVRDGGGAPCRQVRALAESKLQNVERQIADLSRLRDHLRSLVAEWDQRLSGVPDGARAGLLETLEEFTL
jgi:DNA-binding transcriptional MerR regulator